jgi:PD-(D/E)XK nuclease superfamily
MIVHVREPDRALPDFSLTGDLLSFLKCPLQYRLYNRGSLPPSIPVQQWFGEFIHGTMEEAYARWRDPTWTNYQRSFPWTWENQLHDIELGIFNRLMARGLPPPPGLLYEQLRRTEFDQATEDRRGIASRRFEMALNSWGPHLFPLVDSAEVRLRGSLQMLEGARYRSNRFSVTGIVDVLSSVRLREAPGNNIILRRLRENPNIRAEMDAGADDFDVIVDYKGMRRPALTDESWEHQEWQIQMYAWLRRRQRPDRRVLAGVLLYLNELLPSETDMKQLALDVNNSATDLMPSPLDSAQILLRLPNIVDDERIVDEERLAAANALSMPYREDRSFRLVEVDDGSTSRSITEFRQVVGDIENAVHLEMHSSDARAGWVPKPKTQTCVACDFKYHCPKRGDQPKVP